MKLHSPAFEKKLRRGVKAATRHERTWFKDFREFYRYHIRPKSGRWFRPLIPLLLALFIARTFKLGGNVDLVLLVFNLWILATTLFFAQTLVNFPKQSWDIVALSLMPVSDAVGFRWEWDKQIKQSTFLIWDLSIGFIVAGRLLHLSRFEWMGLIVLLPFLWMYSIALGTLAAAYFPKFPYGGISACFFPIAYLSPMFIKNFSPSLISSLNHSALTLNLLLPTGWPLSLIHLLRFDPQWPTAILILPTLVVFWLMKDTTLLLKERCQYTEHLRDEASDIIPHEMDDDLDEPNDSEPTLQQSVGETAIEEGIRSGQFLIQKEWNEDKPQRLLWKWFTPHEKNLAEFAYPNGLPITKSWIMIFKFFLITIVAGLLISKVYLPMGMWCFGIGLFIVYVQVGNQFFGVGNAFRVIPNGGINIPIYAAYPITYRNLSRMFIKCSLIQMPFLIIPVMGSALLYSFIFSLPWGYSLSLGLKAMLMFGTLRWVILVFKFSASTNDSLGFHFRIFALIGTFLLFAFLVIGSVILQAEYDLISWACTLLACVTGYGFFRLYGWFYHSNRFDLMREPR